MIKKVLGFDISSSTVGIALISFDTSTGEIKLLEMDHIKPIKTGSLISRLAHTRDTLGDIINRTQPDHICIEDILIFVSGRSSANTITLLCSFNRMACLLAFDYLGVEPHLYSATTIRNGLRTGYETPAKEEMPELIAKHLDIEFPWMHSKRGKVEVENYDRADGCAAALFDIYRILGKINTIETHHIKPKKPAINKKKSSKSRSKKVRRKSKK